MAKPTGWLPIPRSLFEGDPDWDTPRVFSVWEARIDLYQMAAFAPRTISVAGSVVSLGRGEFLASIRFLSRRWQWSPGRITRRLKMDTATGQLRIQRRDRNGDIYLITNYEDYAGSGHTDEHSNGHGVEHDDRHTNRHSDRHKLEEVKEGKKKKKKIAPPAPVVEDGFLFPLDKGGESHQEEDSGQGRSTWKASPRYAEVSESYEKALPNCEKSSYFPNREDELLYFKKWHELKHQGVDGDKAHYMLVASAHGWAFDDWPNRKEPGAHRLAIIWKDRDSIKKFVALHEEDDRITDEAIAEAVRYMNIESNPDPFSN